MIEKNYDRFVAKMLIFLTWNVSYVIAFQSQVRQIQISHQGHKAMWFKYYLSRLLTASLKIESCIMAYTCMQAHIYHVGAYARNM